ncbi:MAG: hypothetical protein K6F25_00280 [Bacteroidales bacterium]|nr:hypothetical protein [Bacteroidales bacterium]
MRKSVRIILPLLLSAVSCNVLAPEEASSVPEVLVAGTESLDATKTVLSPDGRILWSSGDRACVWPRTTSGAVYQVDESSVGEGLGTFSLIPPAPSGGSALGAVVAYYPYAAGLSCSASGNSYSIGGVTLPATQTYAADSFGPGALPMVTVTTGDELVFSIVCGVLKLQLTGTATISSIEVKGNRSETLCGSATVTASDGAAPSITMTGSGKTVTLDCGSGVPLNGTTPTVFDIVLPPLTMAGGFTVTVNSTDGRTMTLVSQKSQTIKRAGILRMPEREFTTNGGVVDLSATETANCYIVPFAGTYKFRADVGGSSTALTYVAAADVLWESLGTATAPSAGDIVNSVSYADGYITFTATGTRGNAVIAAKSSGGVIRWSWHIWCTDLPADQVYGNGAGTMMDRNLGATSATPGDVKALGLMYQWGRKDPFPGASATARLTSSKAACTPALPSSEEVEDIIGSKSNLSIYSTQHPSTFITNCSGYHDWYCGAVAEANHTLWQSVKAEADPCPPGYRVPTGGSSGIWTTALGTRYGTCANFSGSDLKGADLGSVFGVSGTCWYPAAGCINGSLQSAPLADVGDIGYMGSCTRYGYYAYAFYLDRFGSLMAYSSDGIYRANGYPVRCMKEE